VCGHCAVLTGDQRHMRCGSGRRRESGKRCKEEGEMKK